MNWAGGGGGGGGGGGHARDFSLRPHLKNREERGDTSSSSSNKRRKRSEGEDRISSLPDELVSHILALLPTKDAAAVSVLSKKMRRVFTWMPSLDLDDSPLMNRFETFTLLVDSVLRVSRSPCISKFRLHFGKNDYYSWNYRREEGFCDLDPIRLDVWICFPLTRPRGVREIDLCFRVRNPGKLPSVLFTCETLEVLKIDVNLQVDPVCTPFVFPNLKVVRLCSLLFSEDDCLTKLVSSCPCLEDLEVNCCWLKQGNFISISSSSLKRLFLDIYRLDQCGNSDDVIIDTPNLEYLHFFDNLALRYNIKPMYSLAEAEIAILYPLENQSFQASFQSMLSLVRSMSHFPHLSLLETSLEFLEFGELKDLPVFPNLRYLGLGWIYTKWDEALLPFLKCAPILETLAFPEGLFSNRETKESERQLCRSEAVFGSIGHLKRIEIASYEGTERELDLVTFLSRNALALEELVISSGRLAKQRNVIQGKRNSLESTLKSLPQDLITRSIQLQ